MSLKKSLRRRILLLLFLLLPLFTSSPKCLAEPKLGYKFADGTPVVMTGIAHLDTAISYLHVRERTDNDGTEVERFLASVLLGPGYAWCAALVTYCLKAAKTTTVSVRSARALAFSTKDMIPIKEFLRSRQSKARGYILVFQQGNGRMGHVGFVYVYKDKFYTIEGNTSSGNSGSQRDAKKGGVFPRIREYAPNARLHIIGVLPC